MLEAITEDLGRRIAVGHYRTGNPLPSLSELSEEFGLPIPRIWAAVRALVGKGMVETKPNRGTLVLARSRWNQLDSDILRWQFGEPSAEFVRDLYELRRAIEPAACETAAIRGATRDISLIEAALSAMRGAPAVSQESILADVSFHKAILVASGNGFMAAMATVLETSLSVAFGFQRHQTRVCGRVIHEHEAVYLAIARQDPAGARQAMISMLSRAEADALGNLRNAVVLT